VTRLADGEMRPFGWIPCGAPGCNYRYRLWAHWYGEFRGPDLFVKQLDMTIHLRYAHGYETEPQ
jgi:hypothetical protein